MTLLNEAAETDIWLEDYLKADSSLMSQVSNVYSTFIGRTSEPMPIVRFFLIESDDLWNVSVDRVWSELVYQVEVITDGPDTTEARAIAQRIDQLLHKLRGQSSSTVTIQEVFRRQALFRKEVEGGDPFVYAGGEYVVRTSAI